MNNYFVLTLEVHPRHYVTEAKSRFGQRRYTRGLNRRTAMDFIPYARQNITDQDASSIADALRQPSITRGPLVEAFEAAIANYCGAAYAVAFNNGTAALQAAAYAANVNQNDRLLTTPNTFIATAAAGMHRRATPVFIDIDRNTGNLDLSQLEHNLNSPSSRGRSIIIPVHFAGIPVDMQTLDNMVRQPTTVVIEDAAHALGSTYSDGQRVGCCAWSHMTMFSFHPAKTITTGEGGMITTNDAELYHRLRQFRNNGIERQPEYLEEEAAPWYYEVQELSCNYNFTDFQAALGLSQLHRLESFIEKRRQLVRLYRDLLKDIPHVRLLTEELDGHTAFHLFVVQIDFEAYGMARATLMKELLAKGIGTQVHYIPLYRHPVLKRQAGDLSAYFPQMEAYYAQALSLPLFYDLSEEQVMFIVKTLRFILETGPTPENCEAGYP
jgi:UDP-4-amino-4,6-dideoxy-N-acetyl-beta-L-altrosamine transaminase